MKLATTCYLIDQDNNKILLGRKKHGIAKGICIDVIHKTNDEDDKLVVVPEGIKLSDKEIKKQTKFQERWFEHVIARK